MPDTTSERVLDRMASAAEQHEAPPARSDQGEPPTAAILRSMALGAVAGMRSMTPLALLAAAAQSPDAPVGRAVSRMGFLRRLRSRGALVVLGLAAAGELVADKLPFIPARVSFGPLAARGAVGAIAGAVASSGSGGSAIRGARRGAAAAVVAAFAGYFARTRLSRRTPVPAVVWALAEDTLALALSTLALLPSLAPSARDLLSPGASDRSHETHPSD